MTKKSSKFLLFFMICSLCCPCVYAEEMRVVPMGRTAGIQIYTDGLLVIGLNEIDGRCAAKEAGVCVNDRIIGINGGGVSSSEEFARFVNEHPEGFSLDMERDGHPFTVNVCPTPDNDGVYRLGLWVRDSCAGVGTVTYYDPQSKTFAALGHSVNDVDTGDILSLKSGIILDCSIVSVTKSKRGFPGEINASFGDMVLGDVNANTGEGIFGEASESGFFSGGETLPVAARNEVHTGDAYIMSDMFGSKCENYSIQIKKITDSADKSLVVEVTDRRLLDSAGGIVQGMSGSPIIQDGKLVGAVTHVFINSPSKGYGTLAESMIDAQRNAA